MTRCAGSLIAATLLVLVTGCQPPAEAVLAGQWRVIPEDPGSIENVTYEASFDSNGQLTELSAVRDDGKLCEITRGASIASCTSIPK